MISYIIMLVIWLVLCAIIATWSEKKGHKGAGYFFLSMFLSPLLGVIVVACISDNTKQYCPFCHSEISIEAKVCPNCNKSLIPEQNIPKVEQKNEDQEKWIAARIVELIKEGKSPSDAKIQADAEYVVEQNKTNE